MLVQDAHCKKTKTAGRPLCLLGVIRHLTASNLRRGARGSGLEIETCGAVRALLGTPSYHVAHTFICGLLRRQEDEPRPMFDCFVSSVSETIKCRRRPTRTCRTEVKYTWLCSCGRVLYSTVSQNCARSAAFDATRPGTFHIPHSAMDGQTQDSQQGCKSRNIERCSRLVRPL
jgi:hypothetical protein